MANENETALDRLNRLNTPSEEREFTLEEQMDSVSTDEFLDSMSLAAKNQMHHLVQEVTLDDEDEQLNNEQSTDDLEDVGTVIDIPDNTVPNESEELFNNNIKPKREYRRKNKNEENNMKVDTDAKETNPVFDQVAKDLIDDLRKKNYKINRFDDTSMSMIFDYVYSKF